MYCIDIDRHKIELSVTKEKISALALRNDKNLKQKIIEEMCRIKDCKDEELANLGRANKEDSFVSLYRIARISIKLKERLKKNDDEELFKSRTDLKEPKRSTMFQYGNKESGKICIRSSNMPERIDPNDVGKEYNILIFCNWIGSDEKKRTKKEKEEGKEAEDRDEIERWYCYQANEIKKRNDEKKFLTDAKNGKIIVDPGKVGDVACTLSEVCEKLVRLLGESQENLPEEKFLDSKQIIYYGPPGTGKTRKAKIEAVKIVTGNNCSDIDALNLFEGRINNKGTNEEKENDKKNIKICEKQIQIVQFHPSYSYNEFMETIDARGVNKDGVFKKIASDARNDPDKKYVLIIDEINRANVSEILGELLYGIEYRGQEITTGISNDDFSVPENLYIIGTMNTADRSLQALDYAVRRRFTFKKVKAELPDPKPPKQKEDVKDKGCYEIENGHFFCQNVFKKVQEDVMKSVARGIDPEDIMPGISYFLVNGKNKKTESDPDSYDEDHLKYKMKYELIPLLREYAKNGMFTKRKKLDINEKSLVELLYDNTYFEYLENNLSESEKK